MDEKTQNLIDGLEKGARDFARVPTSDDNLSEIRISTSSGTARVLLDASDEDFVALRVALESAQPHGAFSLWHDITVRDDKGRSRDSAWTDSEMRVFFGRQVFASSKHTRRDVGVLLAMPSLTRELLIDTCTQFDCDISFAKTTLLIDFREVAQLAFYVKKQGGTDTGAALLSLVEKLSAVLPSFPPALEVESVYADPLRCTYCGVYFFCPREHRACTNCGAPVA